MSWNTITLDTDARGVARLTLNRPEKHNVLSGAMCDELAEAAARIDADPRVRVVVLTGAGPSFCAGGDLDWMRAQFAATRAGRMAEARRLAGMLQRAQHAGEAADRPGQRRGLRRRRRADGGLRRGGGGRRRAVRADRDPARADPGDDLALRDGPDRRGPGARGVLLRARSSTRPRRTALGLVTPRRRRADGLDAAVEAEVAPYFATAPAAVAAAKRLARSLGPRIDEAVIEATIARLADTWETPEAQAGIAAFLEKRPPPWAGLLTPQFSARPGMAWACSTSSGTSSSTERWVLASTTFGAMPASSASTQRAAQRHQRSPGRRPGKPNSGRGVDRSLPRCAREGEELGGQRGRRPCGGRGPPGRCCSSRRARSRSSGRTSRASAARPARSRSRRSRPASQYPVISR